MSGFARVYANLWNGTIGSNWEAWSLWLYLLANCDSDGIYEATRECISSRTGIPIDRVHAGLQRLEQPDPENRSQSHAGARIVRIYPHLDWGWVIVNHNAYRRSIRREGLRPRGSEGRAYVYYAGDPGGDIVKIGFSKNPWARVAELAVARPGIKLLGVEDGTPRLERARHRQFSQEHVGGEWFRRTEQVDALLGSLNRSSFSSIEEKPSPVPYGDGLPAVCELQSLSKQDEISRRRRSNLRRIT